MITERLDAAHVIEVVVRREHRDERHTLARDRGEHGLGLRGIDNRRALRRLVDDEPPVVVLEHRHCDDAHVRYPTTVTSTARVCGRVLCSHR